MVKNCDRGLENTAQSRRPRAAFSRPRGILRENISLCIFPPCVVRFRFSAILSGISTQTGTSLTTIAMLSR